MSKKTKRTKKTPGGSGKKLPKEGLRAATAWLDPEALSARPPLTNMEWLLRERSRIGGGCRIRRRSGLVSLWINFVDYDEKGHKDRMALIYDTKDPARIKTDGNGLACESCGALQGPAGECYLCGGLLVAVGTPVEGRPTANGFSVRARYCGCGARLSRYNPRTVCYPCLEGSGVRV
jgi:hypothetical protein